MVNRDKAPFGALLLMTIDAPKQHINTKSQSYHTTINPNYDTTK